MSDRSDKDGDRFSRVYSTELEEGVEWFERVAKLCDTLQCTPHDLFGHQKVIEDD
ncbi:helix-turn-helix domain-containing protein [Nostoc sp. NIES-2111]